ncbi:MAG: diguanylate cyclase [Planctomycetota bacterium]
MRSDMRLLVIGPESFRLAVDRALPRCTRVGSDCALSGVWQSGQQPFEGVLLSLSAGKNILQAVRSLRRVAPEARIVVTCDATSEPGARQALQEGADEYVVEPLSSEDLEQALQIPALPENIPDPLDIGPSLQEKTHFVDVLKNLSDGPQAVLDRLAVLLQQTFDAASVGLRLDDLNTVVGSAETAVLQETIYRGDEAVGTIMLGRRQRGTYPATVATRLADYARLIDVVITVARERSHWQDLAWTDDLSTLRNRRYFERRLDELLVHCAHQRACLTVLLFDIDGFKTYNDHFGHDTGDALIREVAFLLTSCTRDCDVVARYGGDEFAVLFWDAEKPRVPGSRHPSEPVALADRFRHAMTAHEFKCLGPEAPGPVTISGGIACYPWDGHTRAELLRAADDAMLAAKQTGKNRIELARSSPPPAESE